MKGPWFDDKDDSRDSKEMLWFLTITALFLHSIEFGIRIEGSSGMSLLSLAGWLPAGILFLMGWCCAFLMGFVTGNLSWANSLFLAVSQAEVRSGLALLCITCPLTKKLLEQSGKLIPETRDKASKVVGIFVLLSLMRLLQLLEDHVAQQIFLYFLAFFLYFSFALPKEEEPLAPRWRKRF